MTLNGGNKKSMRNFGKEHLRNRSLARPLAGNDVFIYDLFRDSLSSAA
jgi:hypothetical protein